MTRRSFLAYGVGMASAAQNAILEKGKAVVCDGDSVKCPNGHDTCQVINAPIAVGNDSYEYPEVAQLRNYHVLRCDVCKVLFTRE